jgi:phosphoglycerate dehydrogenase-like enzyme
VIAKPGAGIDNLDAAAAERRKIEIVYAPGANARTVAEHTLALMLALVRQVPRWASAVTRGKWAERAGYAGDELGGLALGIVGYGAIGARVAQLARAFDMNVLVAARGDVAKDSAIPFPTLPLHELLPRVDVLSLHAPLTPQTKNLVGAREFALLKPTAYLVNTSRGALIDGVALRDALTRRAFAGFAADVLDVQPPSADDALLACDRVVLTPHVASLTATTYREMCVAVATRVLAALDALKV